MIPRALLLLVAGCASAGSQPLANERSIIAQPPDPCPRDLAWLGEARYLRYAESSHGDLGEWRFHADLYRPDGAENFEGVATASFRQGVGLPIHSASRAVSLQRGDATALLHSLRDGIRNPAASARTAYISVSDPSNSIVIAIEAIGFARPADRHPSYHVEFYTDEGQRTAPPWNIRGCTYDPPYSRRTAIARAAEDLAKRFGHDVMLQQLQASQPGP